MVNPAAWSKLIPMPDELLFTFIAVLFASFLLGVLGGIGLSRYVVHRYR